MSHTDANILQNKNVSEHFKKVEDEGVEEIQECYEDSYQDFDPNYSSLEE